MSISKRDQSLILILVGILIFVAAYVGIYRRYEDKATELENEITAMEPQLQELKSYFENLSTYQTGIQDDSTKISNYMARYPSDVREEDQVMYAVNLEKMVGLTVNSVVFNDPEIVSQFPEVSESGNGSYTMINYSLQKASMTLDCSMTYQQLKKLMDEVNLTSSCTRVSDVSVSYDSATGLLTGTVTVDKYSITGQEDNYTESPIPSMSMGTNNIFGGSAS